MSETACHFFWQQVFEPVAAEAQPEAALDPLCEEPEASFVPKYGSSRCSMSENMSETEWLSLQKQKMNDLRERLLTERVENLDELLTERLSSRPSLGEEYLSAKLNFAEGSGRTSLCAPSPQARFVSQVLVPTAQDAVEANACEAEAYEQWLLETHAHTAKMPDPMEKSAFSFFLECRFVASVFSCSVGIATWCSPHWPNQSRARGAQKPEEVGKYFTWVNPTESLSPSGTEDPEVSPVNETGLLPKPNVACSSTEAAESGGTRTPPSEPQEEEEPVPVGTSREQHIVHEPIEEHQANGASNQCVDEWPFDLPPPRHTPGCLHTSDAGVVRSILTQEIYGKAKISWD